MRISLFFVLIIALAYVAGVKFPGPARAIGL